jgi:hypothetical protein
MSPFMRTIPSLNTLKAEGTDPEFFREGMLLDIPTSLAEAIERWCKDVGVANTFLPGKGATTDEPLEVYYIPLATRSGQAQVKAMQKAIGQVLVDALIAAVSAVSAKAIFLSDANAPMDELVGLANVRDRLMSVARKPAKSDGEDPALIIYV